MGEIVQLCCSCVCSFQVFDCKSMLETSIRESCTFDAVIFVLQAETDRRVTGYLTRLFLF